MAREDRQDFLVTRGGLPAFDSSRAGSALGAWQTERLALGIQKTIHRTYNNALGLIEIALAFITPIGVDDINFITLGYGASRAHRLAKTAIDTFIGNR